MNGSAKATAPHEARRALTTPAATTRASAEAGERTLKGLAKRWMDHPQNPGRTHYVGCAFDHPLCALEVLATLVSRYPDDGPVPDERRPSAAEVYLNDVGELLDALGLPLTARPISPHEVVQREILPAIRTLSKIQTVPDQDALAQARTEARREAMEEAARIAEGWVMREHYDVGDAIAAAIRARAEEEGVNAG